MVNNLGVVENIKKASLDEIRMGEGSALIDLMTPEDLFYKVVQEKTGYEIEGDYQLIGLIMELAKAKKAYDRIEKEIRELIKFAAILRDIDTEGVAPTINIHPIPNATRKDIVEKEFTREELLANAPTVTDGYILVPKVIE